MSSSFSLEWLLCSFRCLETQILKNSTPLLVQFGLRINHVTCSTTTTNVSEYAQPLHTDNHDHLDLNRDTRGEERQSETLKW